MFVWSGDVLFLNSFPVCYFVNWSWKHILGLYWFHPSRSFSLIKHSTLQSLIPLPLFELCVWELWLFAGNGAVLFESKNILSLVDLTFVSNRKSFVHLQLHQGVYYPVVNCLYRYLSYLLRCHRCLKWNLFFGSQWMHDCYLQLLISSVVSTVVTFGFAGDTECVCRKYLWYDGRHYSLNGKYYLYILDYQNHIRFQAWTRSLDLLPILEEILAESPYLSVDWCLPYHQQ